jgi:MFS family permease
MSVRRLVFLRPLRERDFALVFAGTTVSALGDGLYYIALAWQTYELSNIPTAMSIVGVAATLPQLVFLLVGGALSDRMDKRRLLVAADLLRGLAIGLIGVLSLTGALELWMLVALVAVYAAGTSLFTPAATALLPVILPKEELGRGNALLTFSRTACVRVAGPGLGGIAIALFGVGWAFVGDGISFFLSALTLLALTKREFPTGARESLLGEIGEGLRYVRGERWLFVSLAAAPVGLLCYMGPMQVLLPFVVKNELEDGARALGIILASGGAGALLGSLLIGQLGQPRERVLVMYILWALSTFGIAGYAVSDTLWQFAAVCFVAIAGLIVGGIIWTTLLQELVPERLLGRVASVDVLVSFAFVPLSMAITGPIADAIGARTTMLVAGLLGGLLLLAVPLAPSLRALNRVDSARPHAGKDERGLSREAPATLPEPTADAPTPAAATEAEAQRAAAAPDLRG